MIENAFRKIQSILVPLLSAEQNSWLKSALAEIAGSTDLINDLLTVSSLARRRLGHQRVLGENACFETAEKEILPMYHWNQADAARALMLLQAAITFPPQTDAIIECYFQQGDETEVAVITRILILFDNAENHIFHAREVSRTNSKPLYAALAQYNPYPAKFFSDHEFNQLVLKGLFMGIAIAPIIGLLRRANRELSQMCEDYIDERAAAGRSIPADIWLALERFASPRAEAMMIQHLSNDSPEHRYYAAKALQQQQPLSIERRQLLDRFLATEKDQRILALIH